MTNSINSAEQLKDYLEQLYECYCEPAFIADDPISIPHSLNTRQDREIMGFWVSMLAWGQRKSIIASGKKLIELMDGAPYDFISNHQEHDLARFETFRHRTFQPVDTLYFIHFFKWYYSRHDSLEDAFSRHLSPDDPDIAPALTGFHDLFFSLDCAPARTRKHVSTPRTGSACKRLCMFLRWMVRADHSGIDFGYWTQIKTSQLLIPLDVHVEREAKNLQLIDTQHKSNFSTVLLLTDALRQFSPDDPVKYDFSLFGLGVLRKKR